MHGVSCKTDTRERILWITRTAVFIALLLIAQFLTATFGNQYVTGSIVNMILIVSVLLCGPATGLTVGVLSPLFSVFIGIGAAFPPLIPFQMAGNISIVLVWFALDRLVKTDAPGRQGKARKVFFYIAPAAGAAVKFLVLYVGVVLIAVPYIFGLPEAQSAAISLVFSYPQLITAFIGGMVALTIGPPIRKALKFSN